MICLDSSQYWLHKSQAASALPLTPLSQKATTSGERNANLERGKNEGKRRGGSETKSGFMDAI